MEIALQSRPLDKNCEYLMVNQFLLSCENPISHGVDC